MFFCYNLYGVIMQRYFSEKKIDNALILKEDDLYHIKVVMRMKEQDKIEVIYNNELYICSILDDKAYILEHIESENNLLDITLVIPLLVENKMDLILQKSTELGVKRIIPVIMERSKIKLDKDKYDKKVIRWNRICKEASEQSKRLDIPEVCNILELKDIINLEGNKLVCSTKKNISSIKNFLTKNKNCDKIILVIGPEGGISEREEEYLISNNYLPVSLGNLIMRVETVPMYLLSVINYENME